jgi:DNA helicase-2/ATP-dependent DNA helicase PcrA
MKSKKNIQVDLDSFRQDLKKLNKEQLEAVKHKDGPLLVVAGAGTGKTTVLINRLAYLILEEGIKTDEIFLATFTEKAANEMIERSDKILPYGYVDLWINTFHGFGERVLRDHALEIGLSPDFKLLDETAQWIFVKKNLASFKLDYYAPAGNPNKFIKELLNHFSRLKDENISPEEYLSHSLELEKKSKKIKDFSEEEVLELKKTKELAEAFSVYNKIMLEDGNLDFADLINYTIKLFKTRPNILKIYQTKFKYLMLDEFQDTNFSQYELIKILAGKKNNLMVVGDDDQSIYKFRGASISNIMQFKDDYPQAKEIVLTRNYRSRQEILDLAYNFISHNNPNRLEVKLGIDKKLKSYFESEDLKASPISAYNFLNESDEMSFVSSKILEIYKKDPECNWLDFAILTRTNDSADKYSKELSRLNIPNHFVSLKGLYYKPIILDIISYFRLLDDYRESSALFRVLNMTEFKISYLDLQNIIKESKKKYWSLFEGLQNAEKIKGVASDSLPKINKLLNLIEAHSVLARDKKPSHVFVKFVYDSEILKNLNHEKDKEIFSYINQFYQKIKKFEADDENLRLKDFLEVLDFELEAGDFGRLKNDFVDVDTVKVMTVHSAKGLEFKHVFLVDLVERRFPSDNRKDKIPVPQLLIKEKLGDSDNFHIEEERRLFYVALTRAKESLYLTCSKDYGGAREKRPSLFIKESNLELSVSEKINFDDLDFFKDLKTISEENLGEFLLVKEELKLPSYFSYSQFASFDKCPLQYKYAHLLKVPVPTEKYNLTFGKVIHNTLYHFLLPILQGGNNLQSDLFSDQKISIKELNEKRILDLYRQFWQDEGYEDKLVRNEYNLKGKDILKNFCKSLLSGKLPQIYFLEKDLRYKFNNQTIIGRIDRIDKLENGKFEIIDYKTGNAKESLSADDKRQLLLYKIMIESVLSLEVEKMSYYYLEANNKLSFEAKEKDIDKTLEWLKKSIEEINKKEFLPKPSTFNCSFCDFKDICDFRQ